MGKRMKIKIRLIGIVISIALILGIVSNGFFTYSNVSNVYADSRILELKASDLKEGKYPEYYDTDTKAFDITSKDLLILNMDDTLHVNMCDIDCGVELKGDHTLFVDGSVCICGSVTVNDDTGIAFNKEESGIFLLSDSISQTYRFTCFGNLSASNNKYPIISGDAEFIFSRGLLKSTNVNGSLISINGDIYIEGGIVEIDNTGEFARCNDYYMCGGSIVANVNNSFLKAEHINITGGTMDVTSGKSVAVNSNKETSVSGGTIKVISKENAAFSTDGKMKITGGYIEAVSELYDSDYSPIDAYEGITIGDDWVITEPSDGKVIKNTDNIYRIVDSKGSWSGKVIIQKYEKKDGSSKDDSKDGSEDSKGGTGGDSNKDSSGNSSSKDSSGNKSSSDKSKYTNEWVDGKWYNSNGICDYAGIISWKQDEKGWWVEDTLGWYPKSEWQKINGKWYYFTADGYMDYSEYRDGCWLGADGAWVEEYFGGHWMSDSKGWWYCDASGWYPTNQWLWIDGVNYFFGADGYLAE